MKKYKNILGIETSCDDTCAAVVQDGRKILSNVISSQTDFHRKFGGVVPEIAARQHTKNISKVVQSALETSCMSWDEVDAIAVTSRYGLSSSLIVGVAMAKSLSYATNKPLIPIHHVEGHLYSNRLEHSIDYPYISLTISGGHTCLFLIKSPLCYELLGQTIDDAAGEAYDKVARLLGLGFPGGPIIDQLASEVTSTDISFPPPMLQSKDYRFSFSGIKTAVRYFADKLSEEEKKERVAEIVFAFQKAVAEVLVAKSVQAAKANEAKAIAISGGVAANSYLRKKMAEATDLEVYFPSLPLCTDNAAMIAGLAHHKPALSPQEALTLDVSPSASLKNLNMGL